MDDLKNTEKQKYEITILFKDGDADNIGKVENLMGNFGMEIYDREEPRRMKLAYEIDKNNFAIVSLIKFYSDPDKISDFSKELKTQGYAMRSMIIKNPIEEKTGASIRDNIKQQADSFVRNKKEQKTSESSRGSSDGKSVTNEELEKKLEEILN